MPLARLKEDAAVVLFVLFLGFLVFLAWLNPVYSWDLLPYTALATSESSDAVSLHRSAYRTVAREVPREVDERLMLGPPDAAYRRDLAFNPWHFAEQLPFYSVKPLYVLALSTFHSAGMNPVKAARLLSVVSFALLGVVLFLWLRQAAGTLLASLAACCVLATPEFLRTGALVYPDALFSALGLLALYLLFARGRLFPGICLLAVLPFIRPDGLVLVALVVGYLAWKNPGFSLRDALVILLAELLANRMTGWLAGGYGYETLFYHSFVHRLTAPAEASVQIHLADYWNAWKYFFLGTIGTPRPLFFLLGVASLVVRRASGIFEHLCWLGLAYALVHVALFPEPESRYLVVPFALFVLWAIHALTQPRGLLSRPWIRG